MYSGRIPHELWPPTMQTRSLGRSVSRINKVSGKHCCGSGKTDPDVEISVPKVTTARMDVMALPPVAPAQQSLVCKPEEKTKAKPTEILPDAVVVSRQHLG